MKYSAVVLLLSLFSVVVFAGERPLGKKVYETACRNCHLPRLAAGIKAPPAFDRKAWDLRFAHAKLEVEKHPDRFKTPIDYLLSNVKKGKGLMHHGGLCNESTDADKNCSDHALMEAIYYMSNR